ncbi:MAG: FHA domain-containing protein [Actinomycetota bacterium]
MRVVFVSGPRTGDEMEVDRELTVGREGADLEIEDTTVSRRHAAFRPTDEGVEIEDLGSTNGTFVNGARVTSPTVLQPGDFVSIGNSTFEVRGDWRSAETEAVAVPPIATPEQEHATSPISADEIRATRSAIPRKYIAIAALAALLIAALVYFFTGSEAGLASRADELCRRERRALGDVPLSGNVLQENARRIASVRVQLRKAMSRLDGARDADAFSRFLERYAETNGRLRKLANLPRRARPGVLRRNATAVRDASSADARAAEEAGLDECGGLPV